MQWLKYLISLSITCLRSFFLQITLKSPPMHQPTKTAFKRMTINSSSYNLNFNFSLCAASIYQGYYHFNSYPWFSNLRISILSIFISNTCTLHTFFNESSYWHSQLHTSLSTFFQIPLILESPQNVPSAQNWYLLCKFISLVNVYWVFADHIFHIKALIDTLNFWQSLS